VLVRERPPDYADRLPRLVPREEKDISHLSDEMADLLYPGWRQHPFRLGLTFDAFDGEDGRRAVELARTSPEYREEEGPGGRRHHAAFETSAAPALRDLFELVGRRAGTEVTVGGQRAPYGHELWLPLFWIFVGARAS
jgi:hypothetical protein